MGQTSSSRFHPVVVEAHPVNQALVLAQTKQTRAGISGLGPGGERAYLHKTKAHGRPRRHGFGIFVQTGCQANGIGKTQAGDFYRLSNRSTASRYPPNQPQSSGHAAKKRNASQSEAVGRFR
jgi:hypothetical protein